MTDAQRERDTRMGGRTEDAAEGPPERAARPAIRRAANAARAAPTATIDGDPADPAGNGGAAACEAPAAGANGAEKRRRWSHAEKLAVVTEASGPTTNMSAVARRHGITPTQLYRWKRTPAIHAETPGEGAPAVGETPSLTSAEADGDAAQNIEIQLRNGRRIRVPLAIDADVLAKVIKAVDT